MIKVIVFDFGGVLFTWDDLKLAKELSKELGVSESSIIKARGSTFRNF